LSHFLLCILNCFGVCRQGSDSAKNEPQQLKLNLIVVATGVQNTVAAAATTTSLVSIMAFGRVVDFTSVADLI
jgi:hypothetical protein